MSLIGLHALLMSRKQEVKSALHDAATTFEIDPHDEMDDNYEYALLFDTRQQAERVAEFALATVPQSKRSIVNKVNGKWLATISYE